MLRSTLIVAGVGLLCSAGLAQHAIDPSTVYPITVPVKDAGTFNWETKSWMSPQAANQLKAVTLTVYNNSCTWTGGAFYTGTGSCEDYIDEGEIPGPDNTSFKGLGATADNNINSFQFGYCTKFVVPNIKVGFYHTLGGRCGGIQLNGTGPATPLSTNPHLAGYFDLSGLGLPGAPVAGTLACWFSTITFGNGGFCLKSEAEGVWDNNANLDRFSWSFQMDNPQTSAVGATSGIILSGEPVNQPAGFPSYPDYPGSTVMIPGGNSACTYNIPCGTDYFGPGNIACGHGLNNDDGFWINVDGDMTGDTTNTGVHCFSAPATGNGCYWFGGYPGNPFGGFYMVLGSSGACAGCTGNITTYCPQLTPTVQQSCLSSWTTTGTPDVDNPAPFTCTCNGLNSGAQLSAILFYGYRGTNALPWGTTGRLCVKSPIVRTGSNVTGGGGPCLGSVSRDMNAVIAASSLPPVNIAGQQINCQVWERDQGNNTGVPSTLNTSQSMALQFVMCP